MTVTVFVCALKLVNYGVSESIYKVVSECLSE